MKKILSALALVFVMTTIAYAHSWYPIECCHERDCAPILSMNVLPNGDRDIVIEVTIDGKKEIKRAIFPADFSIRVSEDEKSHACISYTGKPLCLFFVTGS